MIDDDGSFYHVFPRIFTPHVALINFVFDDWIPHLGGFLDLGIPPNHPSRHGFSIDFPMIFIAFSMIFIDFPKIFIDFPMIFMDVPWI